MSEQKDRPEICRDCSRYETDCQGSNQEDCARRLDRPNREKIISDMLVDWKDSICRMVENNCETVAKTPIQITKEIIALLPDEKEIRKKERERIVALIESYNSIDYAYGAEYKEAILQALEGGKLNEQN